MKKINTKMGESYKIDNIARYIYIRTKQKIDKTIYFGHQTQSVIPFPRCLLRPAVTL